MANEKITWVGKVDNVNPAFVDCLSTSMNHKAMQVAIAGNVAEVLKEREMFSTVLHTEGSPYFSIALRNDRYAFSNIDKIHVNFNRFNMSFILVDSRKDDGSNFGVFRFKTRVGKPTSCTFTGMVRYSVDDDVLLINELKEIFYIAEVMYNNEDRHYRELATDLDFDEVTIYELCQIYTGDYMIAGRIAQCGHRNTTVSEFVRTVDLKEFRKNPGIGNKTILTLERMYYCYGLDKLKEE